MRSKSRLLQPLRLATILLASTVLAGGHIPQDLQIEGRVSSKEMDKPLADAQVHVTGTGYGTLTDSLGRYAFTIPRAEVPPQGIRLVVQLLGFGTEERLVPGPTAAGDTLTVDFRLSSEAIGMDELVVTGEAVARQRRSLGAQVASVARAPATAPPPTRAAPEPELQAHPRPGWPGRSPQGMGNREQYAHIAENTFQSPDDHPLSTFSIDVDRASYSNIRRFLLREGRLPPVDAVQIEEMVNYFSYDYELPGGRHPVAVTTEVGQAPWAPRHRLLRVGLASRPIATDDMPAANLVFLLDVSGSMRSPDKLPLVQASMRLLVDGMRPQDRVAIVVYAGAAGLVLESTSGAYKGRILEAIDGLLAGGSTAGGAGLRLAYRVAERNSLFEGNNRVILATDGDFNVGESSDAAMIRLVEERREQGTFLTVLGFGTGNLQSEKMQSLAQHGNGNYAYIDGLPEARKVLVREMGGTLLTVAKDMKVQIEFNPARVGAYRLLGYENRLLAAEDFNDDARDAGELGAGHTVTALYEIIPVDVDSHALPGRVDPLRYQESGRMPEGSGGDELAFVKVRYKLPSGTKSRLLEHGVQDGVQRVSNDFSFAAAVAGFGMLLRKSGFSGSLTPQQVLALAEDGLGADPGGDRHGFLELVRAYEALECERHRPCGGD